MKWRTLLAALIGILLPVPAMWLLYATFSGSITNPIRTPRLNVVPMLTPMERLSVLTYGRECRTDADCDPRLRCFFSMVTQDSYCVDSRCMTDAQCPEGFTCQTYTAENDKDLLKACTLVGDRKEGEECAKFTRKRQYGCARGLLCHYRCGRPCQLDDPSSCPGGFFCAEGRQGPPSCLPTCKGRPCPDGLKCISRGNGVSVCARMHGEDCRKVPCPEKHLCQLLEPPQRPWELRTECRRICDKDASCPAGYFCHDYGCRKPCEPQAPETCGPGLTCGQHYPDDPWYCMPG